MSHPTDILDVIESEERQRVVREVFAAKHEDDLVELMKLDVGRRFVSRLLELTGCNAASFTIDNPDPCVTAFREGRRDIGRVLQAQLYELCPANYDLMLRERAAEIRQMKKELSK